MAPLGPLAAALALAAAASPWAWAATAEGRSPAPAAVDRLYILDCGELRTKDLSANWTPGAHVGEAFTFSNNCYLIRHARHWLLWETGINDAVESLPDGKPAAGGLLTLFVRTPLIAQLAALGLKPEDIEYVAVSHFHIDHVGNLNAFARRSQMLVQRKEYESAFAADAEKRGLEPELYDGLKQARVTLLDGDHDVFGDGAVVLLSTPGHTPGHQSLLVRLRHRGTVIIGGDVVHTSENWRLRRVPLGNFSAVQTRASIDRIAALLKARDAELWINHDRAQSERLPHAPAFLD